MEKIYLTSDHAAFTQKEMLKEYLGPHYEVIDLGATSEESVHYPEFGKKIAHAVLESNGKGIALCGSGIGISIQVNRFKGIRGGLCNDVDDAKMTKLHNNANILCLAGRKHSDEKLKEMVKVWLETEFEGGRHQTRIDMLDQE
ncbi:MAG: ribose 5-phosphate isomerase B [Halobacteriovoraceae bacterium]|nr:ribose 5-phosphate isomerase B [Halobacteriovoraceae bacterium]|tara:strand:+ start:5649 stop:6077 length:429 start_codon:yes stop_codon:yes gene_type:complete